MAHRVLVSLVLNNRGRGNGRARGVNGCIASRHSLFGEEDLLDWWVDLDGCE